MDISIHKPVSEFPELFVTVPDEWPTVRLAPLYDAHVGHRKHATALFLEHLRWLGNEPYTLTWNGGDLIENAIVGAPGIFDQKEMPADQLEAAALLLKPIQEKMLFAIPGNHEARTARVANIDLASFLADKMGVKYFPDYCFCTIKWRGNNFRICAHHGTGAAATPGGQRNAARKDLTWVKADFYWTGHLHQPIADLIYQADFDQATGKMVTRSAFAIISPSYLMYFGGYAASKRLAPGVLGLVSAELREDGRIDVMLHAKGHRL